jgi:hypothetical protein
MEQIIIRFCVYSRMKNEQKELDNFLEDVRAQVTCLVSL